MKCYAVARGKRIGIFNSWTETKSYVIGYPNAKFKSFSDLKTAEEYLKSFSAGDVFPDNLSFTDNCSNQEIFSKREQELDIQVLEIYTDGSCVDKIGGYGYLYLDDRKNIKHFKGRLEGESTN